MHELLHIIGICPDTLSHPSLLSILGFFGVGFWIGVKSIPTIIYNKFKKPKKCECKCEHEKDTE